MHRLALARRQQHQQVVLAFHAQEVHVQTGDQLMAEIAIDIEAGDQQIVDALQHRVIDDPARLGHATDQPLHHRRIVEVAIDGQGRVGIAPLAGAVGPAAAVPQHSLIQAQIAIEIGLGHQALLGLEVGGLLALELDPGADRQRIAALLGGQAEILPFLGQGAFHFRVAEHLRIGEADPEVIIDHIHRDLTATDRPLDEAHDGVLRLIQHEAIA